MGDLKDSLVLLRLLSMGALETDNKKIKPKANKSKPTSKNSPKSGKKSK